MLLESLAAVGEPAREILAAWASVEKQVPAQALDVEPAAV